VAQCNVLGSVRAKMCPNSQHAVDFSRSPGLGL
jgi:hypothetical protein